MARKGSYPPAMRRDLVKRLYFAAKDLRVPMTALNDRRMEESHSRICEAPAKIIPPSKRHQPGSRPPPGPLPLNQELDQRCNEGD